MKSKNIRKTFLLSDIIILFGTLVVGALLLPFGSAWTAVGAVVIACGACMIPFCIHGFKIESESGIFREVNVPVSRDCQDEIISFLEGDVATPSFKFLEQGGALISVYYQKNSDVSFAQFYEYNHVMEGKSFPLLKITPAQKETILNLKS